MISEELEQKMRDAEDAAIRAFEKQTGLKLHGYTPSVIKTRIKEWEKAQKESK